MEEDVLNALQTRTAYLPGGFDRNERIIIVVNIINDLQLWNRKCLDLSIAYLKRSLSSAVLQRGVTVIVDAQCSTSRITRAHARHIYALFGDVSVNLYLVRSEGFWEKHVEPCTKSHTKGEPIVLSKGRLPKYFDLAELPEELGGTLQFNYDLWLQQRKSIDEFQKSYEETLNAMEQLHVLLLGNKSLRPADADVELKKCAETHATVQRSIEAAIEMGNRFLTRLTEAYTARSPSPPHPPQPPTAHQGHGHVHGHTPAEASSSLGSASASASASTSFGSGAVAVPAMAKQRTLPPDLSCERTRIELRLNEIERKQTAIRTAWLELLQCMREARELAALESGVAFVTNWIMGTAEQLLGRQRSIGCSVRACETLRSAHNAFEMECRETYGIYAELLYKIEAFAGGRDSDAYRDLVSQRDFMHFVCRSFATRLERRRNALITSLRFFRLVADYFDRTTVVFESLVMGNKTEDFAAAAANLQKLKDSQASLANIERELVKEGEKLSDILAMPVKDALGRDLHIDYSDEIGNIRDILETTMARRKIFSDSVELQKLTLEQVTHIRAYELDAAMAIQWMDDLYAVMIRCHSHVGCNIHEIQVQKDELQTFQETGKSIYTYGCQLLEASRALRAACKLDDAVARQMSEQLRRTWHSLLAISQEHMTRLRVSAVFHRSVEEYSQQLYELRLAVRQLARQNSSSSGISSEADSPQPSPLVSAAGAALEPPQPQPATTSLLLVDPRDQLRKYLAERELLLLEVGRMVRLGRLLKTRLKEPFVLDAITGKSVVVDDLTTSTASATGPAAGAAAAAAAAASDAISPSGDSGHCSNISSDAGNASVEAAAASGAVVVSPTGNNDIACHAISHKLKEIAEVAESLDAAIRDVQSDSEVQDTNSSSSEKKLETLRSNSSEDWHSRSTEDESFATASEGNFTPHSHSSSFQTASGRTSSFISSGKNSFDASEADDSTFAFEMPELTSPINMSYDSSDRSYLSARQSPAANAIGGGRDDGSSPEGGAAAFVDDQSSIVDVEELHSQSVTPTPGDSHYASIPVESESELEEQSCIADAPSMEILTEVGPVLSVTPESPDKIYIKVVELEPKITTLGANFDESLHMQLAHDETLRNIQNLPGPMDEFVQKADKLLASKRISSELVNAMADTLNVIWQDIRHLLTDRQHILHLCTQFHDKMAQCQRRMDQLEVACIDTMPPIAHVEFLGKFKQLRIDMLTAVMAALKDGNELLAQLQDLSKLETLDTRPEHIKRDALRAVHQVQQWLEALHDRRNALEIAWQTRKTQLEQCAALSLLGHELDELETALRQQRDDVASMFSLGECEHTANTALHNYREWKQRALVLRDRALKITRAKEKLQAAAAASSGGSTFGSEEACARAYHVLSACTEHLNTVDQREHWLQQSRDFFAKAENTLVVLEKLEVELSNVKLPPNSPESYAMYAKVARDVRNFTEEPLRLGYGILDEVGRTQPETQGVKRVLDEIENRKVYIESICSASNEDAERVQRALAEFLDQYNDLLAWLMSSGQMYLQQHVEMGRNLQECKQFLLQHHELMQDLEIKGELINLLLESIKVHLESLSAQQRYDVDSKAEALHRNWIELKDYVLKRVDCVSLLIEFFAKANVLGNQLDNLDRQLTQTPDEQKLQFLRETWANIRADYADLKTLGMRFITMKIVDPYLETKSSASSVEDILNGFSKRQVDVTTSLESWTTHITEKREVEIILEKIMSENEQTASKTTQVDTQLYPVFTSPSIEAPQLAVATRDKLAYVLLDIEKAQDEIQERIHTTLAIHTKDAESLQKIEQVVGNLRTLKAKLDGIKYDYKTLLESMLHYLDNIAQLRREIDDHQQQQQQHDQQQQQTPGGGIERIIAEHERFRDSCMDKFRSLIAKSELLIDRVRALEPPGAREIDTDRILKLLENLRIHFEAGSSARMSSLERQGKLQQFATDLGDIDRSLDSVSAQLHDINGQSIDSLAAAKTTSLAFEYFERTIELLEKRIEKFTETTTQQLCVTNPESEAYVRDELRKLGDKWQQFKDQVRSKRNSLNQATEFFEVVEKIDAEYREISYFYNSISNKITYLRDPVEAANLVNDIEKYVGSRERPLREKIDNAAKCSHDMNKVSTLYNDVSAIFQAFLKLKADINVVQERLKSEERMRELREKEAREQAEREKAMREAEARERIAREEEARAQALREQMARENAARELAALELAARERALREEELRLQAIREQAARDQQAREQAAREEEARLRTLREEEARLQALRDQAKRDEEARLQALRDQAKRDEEARLQALRDQVKREEEARLEALRDQAKRDEEARMQALREQANREEEARLQALRDQVKREEEARLLALREQANREEEARLQALREHTLREEVTRLQTVRDHVDHQRIVTENIRKDIQVNEMFTEIKYSSPCFTRPLRDAITREGDKLTLECEVAGNPEPAVEWFKDGISIQSNPDYKTTCEKGVCRLMIEETFAADSAHFTCHASNLVGAADTTASLSVRENAAEVQMVPPRIVRFLESGKATEGSSFQFACAVTGNPLPTVQWYKNDKCIDDSPDYIINYNNGEATLRFEEVFLEDDAVYTCSASNPAGIEHCSASLIVEPLEPTELPHFKIPLSNAMARVGQKIKLEALIGGIPRPEIYWLHNGKPFNSRNVKYEYGRVTLIVPQAYPNDAGLYVLTAKNLAGEAYSSCNVNVKGRLPNETSDSEMASDMEPIKPSLQLALKDISIFEGKPVRLDCVIVGQPEPEVIWYHNDRPVKESTDVQLLFQGDRCSLIIREVYQEDAGHYRVVAINSAGEATSSCDLKVTPLNIAEPATRANAERHSLPKDSLPKFERLLSDVLADEGETVEMEVLATGDQPLTAKWYLSNKELLADERIAPHSDAAAGVFKLVFKNVSADDKGVYTVKVSNGAGDAKCFSHLIVKSVNATEQQRQQQQQQIEIVESRLCPEFKELFSDRNAHPDEVVKFECIVKGKPTPKVHWYFNEQPVHGHNFLVSTSGERQVLTVQQASPETVGQIKCVAENEVGKATCVAFLSLIGEGLQAATLPASSDLQTMTQEHNTESSRVTIKKQTFTTTSTSQVNSYEGNMPQTEVHHSSAHIDQSLKQLAGQRPEIVESHHYQELHKSKDMAAPQVQQKSFVLVQSAATAGGTAPPPTITAALESPTRIRRQIAPRFTTPLTGRIVDQGADVSMEAIYDGFPSPEIKVEKNGEQLFAGERTRIENKCNRITIDLKQVGVADAGRYAVTAINTMGQSTSTADLVVKKTIFPPVFGRRLQAQVVKKGEKIIMEVEVTGLPEPTVVWMKDDKPLRDAGLSEHRLLSQGNSYKLIIERGQTTDSGKYMVKATNAGGEAKSIADCAILEPSPERMQEVVKTIVYETPHEFKTESFAKEPQSFETNQSEVSTASDLHGLSESKIITEHRCTTEATMRLEHKSAYLDLPELSQRATPSPTPTSIPISIPVSIPTPTPAPPTPSQSHSYSVPIPTNLDVSFVSTATATGSTQTPPQVPPKPHPPVTATQVGGPSQPPPATLTTTSTSMSTASSKHETNTTEKKSSSFEYFKRIDGQPPCGGAYQKFEAPRPAPLAPLALSQEAVRSDLQADLQQLNLVPGSPPEICYVPKLERSGAPKPPLISEKIKRLEESRQLHKEAPQGGVALLPPVSLPTASQSFKHETLTTKEVKVEYGQPIMRPAAANLPAPKPHLNRSPSPKPSAEGLAMAKLWTPTLGVSGYESCTSDLEQNSRTESEADQRTTRAGVEHEIKVHQLPTPTTELSAPFLVQQATQAMPSFVPTAPRAKPLPDDIPLVPGTPPEICFAPKAEVRRHSLVETMEKTLERNVLEGPSRVLPMSVPTLTPAPSSRPVQPPSTYRPPPPVMPTKLGRGEFYESDYESDRWKYSGSESDDASFRPAAVTSLASSAAAVGSGGVSVPTAPYHSFKTSGYAADTEEISSYRKTESSSMQESRSYFMESTSTGGVKAPPPPQHPQPIVQAIVQPPLEKQPPAQLYYSSQGGQEKREFSAPNEYRREEKNFKSSSSMTSNRAYNVTSTSSSTAGPPKFQSTPFAAPSAPSPVAVRPPSRTPAEFSDYSSEVDERFRSVSRTYESDPDIKGYRVVFPPTPVPKASLTNGHKSPVVVVTPSPMEFEPTPPQPTSTYLRPKFEPIKKEIRHEIKTETQQQQQHQHHQHHQQQQKSHFQSQQQQQQHVYKPKPVAAKFIAATQQQHQLPPQPLPQPQPTVYYNAIAGTPLHMAKLATETKNVMHMKESSETCERVVNMQQTKRVIQFDSRRDESSSGTHGAPPPPALEPFPYSPGTGGRSTPGRSAHLPPPTPTKFVPGEFRESDYESEVDGAQIRPLWTPHGEYGPLRYRHVEPPHPGRSCSLPRSYERVLSPMEFDRGPEMPTKIQIDAGTLRRDRATTNGNAASTAAGSSSVTTHHKTQSLNRRSSMRSSFNQQRSYHSTLHEHEQGAPPAQSFPRDDMNLKVGSPPKYGYIQAHADSHGQRLGSTFLQKSHQFIDDVASDLRQTKTQSHSQTQSQSQSQMTQCAMNGGGPRAEPKVITHAFRPGFKRAPSEGENRPQAYRDETRVSQYGTKCVDPNTGLIYFKYDFGYEFGILFPGEGRKFVGKQWNSAASSLPPSQSPSQPPQLQAGAARPKSPYPLRFPGGGDLVIPVQHERTASTPPRFGVGSKSSIYSQQCGAHSDTEMAPTAAVPHRLQKRYSLPNTQTIDIHIDRLHGNERWPTPGLQQSTRTVTELPSDVPVNAHLNRDDHPKKPPQFITPLKDIAVIAGQTARFECIVQCHPQPNVAWSKNGYDLQDSSQHCVEYRNGVCRLTMPQTQPDDGGVYACTAANPLGTATTSGALAVQGKYRN